jgi:nucleotide-binding universal stress UspA family protein
MDLVLPEGLEDGPPAGKWRGQITKRSDDRLFRDLLVPINGKEDGWCALEQAIQVARRESGELFGLHVIPTEEEEPDLSSLQEEFNRRCAENGIQGNLIVTQGEIVDQTCLRATATDMVVVNLTYPPGGQPISRLTSGFRNLISRCPRPVLATPQTVSGLNHALLAFDGSPKAQEALFVATYLSKKWAIPLVVATVAESSRNGEQILKQAEEYLKEHDVQADFILESGAPGEVILDVCQRIGADFMIMGGYGFNALLEVMLGSTVDTVLRMSEVPTLICR